MRNFYELEKSQYEKLLRENVTKMYKRAEGKTRLEIDQELMHIAAELNIGDRIEKTSARQAFITLKDHKNDFKDNPKCRIQQKTTSDL